jgi:hypothetical protein
MPTDMTGWSERQRIQDEERYGLVADRRRGRIRVMRTLFEQGLTALPRMTRIIGFQAPSSIPCDMHDAPYFEVIVESPDIPPPAEDGTLPLLDLDINLHSMPRDLASPCLSVVEYVVSAQWGDCPETRAATPLFGRTMAYLPASQAKLFKAIDRSSDPDGDFSAAYVAMRKAKIVDLGVNENWKDCKSWMDVIAALPEETIRELLAVHLDAFWGRIGG